MSKYRFRLQAKLALTEHALEQSQLNLAIEEQKLKDFFHIRHKQAAVVRDAIEGQRQAGLYNPQELRLWLNYLTNEKAKLQYIESNITKQKAIVEEKRFRVMEDHQEVEKFKKLKEKQLQAYNQAVLKIEQNFVDELGQILFYKNKEPNHSLRG